MNAHLHRRSFLALLSTSAAAWPIAARAQQRRGTQVIGLLSADAPGVYASAEFHRGLGEGGFIEGRNVEIEYHWADGRYDRLPALAADLVRRQVSVITVPGNTRAALAAKAAT